MPPLMPAPPPVFFGGRACLAGRVLDAETGAGITRATLFLKEAGTWSGSSGTGAYLPERAVYVTDENGYFRVEGLRDRRYHLDVEAPGYLRFLAGAALSVERPFLDELHLASCVESGHWHVDWERALGKPELLRTAFPLVEGGSTPPLRVYLRRGQRLRGSVRDAQGKALSGASVTIESQVIAWRTLTGDNWAKGNALPNRPCTTDAEGRFTLAILPGSRVHLRFSAPGRPEERRSVDLLTHEGPIEVTLGGGRVLRGRVPQAVDRDCRVLVFEPKDGGRVWEASTGTGGDFSIEGLVGERWVVIASAFPLGGAVARIIDSLDASLELELQDERQFQAKVVDASGVPQPGALVSQEVVLKHPGFTAEIDSFRMNEHHLVASKPDGTLRVPAHLQAGFATADGDGVFRMSTILDQKGQVRVRANARNRLSGAGWVSLRGDETLVLREWVPPSPRMPEGPRVGDLATYLSQLKSSPIETRRRLILELRHELKHGAERPDLLPHFLLGLADEDHEVRTQAVLGLSEIRHSSVLEPLVSALKHEDWIVRHYAICGLRAFEAKAVPALREVMAKEESPDLRVSAAGVLVELGEVVDPNIFYEALRGDDDHHGEAAALAKLGRKEAIELLIDALARSASDYFLIKTLQALTGITEHLGPRGWRDWFEKNRATLPPQVPVELEPPDTNALHQRALRRYKSGNLEGAVSDFTRALEQDAKDAYALGWRGFLRLERGEAAEAESDFTRLLELPTEDPRFWLMRAQARSRRGDVAGTRADLEKALALAPADWPYRETALRLRAELH